MLQFHRYTYPDNALTPLIMFSILFPILGLEEEKNRLIQYMTRD